MPKTKFFIEAIPLVEDRPSGVGHALSGLVGALMANEQFQRRYEVILVVPKRALSKLDKWPALKNCTRKGLPVRFRILNGLMKFHLLPPMDMLLGKGIYIFGNFKNWPVTKQSFSLTYIYDIAFALYPEFVAPKNQQMLIKSTPRFIEQTNAIITISNSSRQEIVKYYKIDPEKVLVLYIGVDTSLFHPYSPQEIAETKKRYGVSNEYFIFIGNIEPRKNLLRLVRAFSALPKRYSLVLVGGNGWLNETILQAIESARHDGVSIIKPDGYVNDEDCARLMSGAVALVHPALHEGFGMPPVEAMAAHVPVLAANIPVLREVLGDACLYFDPLDVSDMTQVMERAILLSDAEKTALCKKGIIRIKRFTWDTTVQCLLQFLAKNFN